MEINKPIDLSTAHYSIITALLQQYLPGVKVWAYGSRVQLTSHPASDLDLAVFISPAQKGNFIALNDAFAESDLPFRVDLMDWNSLPENFKAIIEKKYVELQ